MKTEMTKELVLKIGKYLLLVESYEQIVAAMEVEGKTDDEIYTATNNICKERMTLVREVSNIDKFWVNEMLTNTEKLKKIFNIK